MGRLTRRHFTSGLAAAAAFGFPAIARAQGAARIVIIGGGAGGATVASRLKLAAPQLDVTLIEARAAYTTCFHSNLYLGGLRSYASLVQSYDGLRALGVNVVTGAASDVDTAAKAVKLADGSPVPYDRLVLSPGIAFKYEAIEDYSADAAEIMPHAWQAGPQTQLLKRQIAGMRNGGTVVMTVPALPYRCPPAPYERACMIAHYLKAHKPKSKLILVDAKRSFIQQALFEDAFATLYKDQIEVVLSDELDDNTVARVDTATGEVETKAGRKIVADVANIIPPQCAGEIAVKAGCADGDWCPVAVENFKSARVGDVYVIGDSAAANDMPKSASSASSQARIVAADILAAVAGKERVAASYSSNCWSVLAPDDGVKIAASFAPGTKDGKPALVSSGFQASATGESADVRRQTYEESLAWYDTITEDAFARKAPGAAPAPAAPTEPAAEPAPEDEPPHPRRRSRRHRRG